MFVTLAYIACIVSRIVYMLNGDELYMLKSNKAMLCYVINFKILVSIDDIRHDKLVEL